MFHFQTAQKISASLRSSVPQFENSMTSYRVLLLNNAHLPMFSLLMSYHSQQHFISLRCIAANEFYRMMRMGAEGHVGGDRTETDE